MAGRIGGTAAAAGGPYIPYFQGTLEQIESVKRCSPPAIGDPKSELQLSRSILSEADYEAWKLLLEQMKAAEAAQESNLGQALAPAIADS